jgi:hypothetical protein
MSPTGIGGPDKQRIENLTGASRPKMPGDFISNEKLLLFILCVPDFFYSVWSTTQKKI